MKYTVELREDQWDLIVLAMEHIRKATTGPESTYGIDALCRKFLRRNVDEIVRDIQATIPAREA